LRNQAETEDVPVEFHLVLRELQKGSFTGNERVSIEKKRMENVLGCEDKPPLL
jgi:hypothetical protein